MIYRRKWTWLLLAAAHLTLVIAGATSTNLGVNSLVARALNIYGSWTGANSGYAFFAPGVSSQLRAQFEVLKSDGKTVIEDLEAGYSTEAQLRMGNIIGFFWNGTADRNARRSIAASWAGKVYGRHPDAQKVTVKLESYDLPSMKEFREGRQPKWDSFYRASFLKRGT